MVKILNEFFNLRQSTLESGISIRVRLLIFEVFSRGYVLIKGGYVNCFLIFKKLFKKNFPFFSFGYVQKIQTICYLRGSYVYLRGYVYYFCQMFQGLCLFKGVRLFRTLEYFRENGQKYQNILVRFWFK